MKLNQRGFTLLEIMVATVILAGLSLLTANAIKTGLNNREKFALEMRDTSNVRDALKVMERDINLAFHHRDFYTDMINDIRKQRAKAGGKAIDPNQPADQQGGVELKTPPKELTAFFGESEQLHFTALSNVRLYKDAPESEQAEVGYFVRACKGRKPRGGKPTTTSSQCLVRRSTPNVDDDVTQGGDEVILLEDVTEFKLRYFGDGRDEWVEQWKTGKNGDALSKENFPLAVEISLSVKDENDNKSRPVSMVMVAPIHFPNNPPKKQDGQPGAPLGGQ